MILSLLMISTVKMSQLCKRFSDLPKFELYRNLNIELLLSLYLDVLIIGSTCMCCSILTGILYLF